MRAHNLLNSDQVGLEHQPWRLGVPVWVGTVKYIKVYGV